MEKKDVQNVESVPPAPAATGERRGKWRIPTKADFEALLSSCDVSWTSKNGHDGRLFTSRRNGESIFLPASGCRINDALSNVGP